METIDLAVGNKWRIEVAYVYRDLELALYGSIEREREVGRGVPIGKLPKVHRDVQKVVLELTELYRRELRVSFLYLHNLGTKEVLADTPQVKLLDLETNGALHYLERHEQYYTEKAHNISQAHGESYSATS